MKRNVFSLYLLLSAFVTAAIEGKLRGSGMSTVDTKDNLTVHGNSKLSRRNLSDDDSDLDTGSDLMYNITEYDSYNQDWVSFDSTSPNYAYAYEVISKAVSNVDNVTSLRDVYYKDIAMVEDWRVNMLYGLSDDEISDLEANDCNSTCQTYVMDQLYEEVDMVYELYTWFTGYQTLQNDLLYRFDLGLTAAKSNLSLTDDVYVETPETDNSDDSWFTSIVSTVSVAANIASLSGYSTLSVAMKLASGTASLVADAVTSSTSTTSTSDISFDQNNMVNLQYSSLLTSIENTYDNLNAVAANQVEAICGNYGKLLSFQEEVYPYSTVSLTDIDEWIYDADPYFEWQSFAWLFNSKYQLCYDNLYTLEKSDCDSYGADGSITFSYTKSTEDAYVLWTKEGTCAIEPTIYFAEIGQCNAYPLAEGLEYFDTNSYAIDNDLISSYGYITDTLTTCIYDSSSDSCTVAGITLDITNNGDCGYQSGDECCESYIDACY